MNSLSSLDAPVFRSVSQAGMGSSSFAERLQNTHVHHATHWNSSHSPIPSKQLEIPPLATFSSSSSFPSSSSSTQKFLDFPSLNQWSIQVVSNKCVNSTVPICPSYVERHTAFISQPVESSQHLLTKLTSALKQLNVECDENPIKHKIKCVNYSHSGCQRFVIRLYQLNESLGGELAITNPDNCFVVEFQKRTGCTMAFNYLYRSLRAGLDDVASHDLAKDDFFAVNASATPCLRARELPCSNDASIPIPALTSWNSAPFDLPSLITTPPKPTLNDIICPESVQHLCAMLDRLDPVCANEALSALSSMSGCALMKAITGCKSSKMSLCSMVCLLQKLLSSEDLELARSAAVLFANVVNEDAFREHLKSGHINVSDQTACAGKLMDIIFTLLDEPANHCSFPAMFQRDIKRNIAKGIASLATKDTQYMQSLVASHNDRNLDYMGILHNYNNVADERLQSHVRMALERLVY